MKLAFSTRVLLVALTSGSSALAEVLHVRGPNADFQEIGDAVAAAADGDTIRVQGGNYERFAIDDKDLTIVGRENTVVHGVTRVRNLSAAKTVRISRLQFRGDAVEALLVYDNEGQVQLQDCVIRGTPGSLWFDDFNLSAPGMRLLNSSAVTMTGCTVEGGDGPLYDEWHNMYDPVPGAEAIVVGESESPSAASALVIHGCELRGGDGSDADDRGRCGEDGAPGVLVLDDSRLWVFGATLAGGDGGFGSPEQTFTWCGDGGDGAPALLVAPGGRGAVVREWDNAWIPGSGGAEGPGVSDGYDYKPCNPGSDARATSVSPGATLISFPGTARGLSLPVTAFDDVIVDVTVTGEPGDLVHLMFSAVPRFSARPRGVLLLGQPRWSSTQPIGVIPAGGVLVRPMPRPAAADFAARSLGVQATMRDTAGQWHLSSARWITVIDAAWR